MRDSDDYIKFIQNVDKRPILIALKKNSRDLKKWKNNLVKARICVGNPLFIADDEADVAILNTLVNQNGQSIINKRLAEIRKTLSCSIYLEVTGTPQALFLQNMKSGHKPYITSRPAQAIQAEISIFRRKNRAVSG